MSDDQQKFVIFARADRTRADLLSTELDQPVSAYRLDTRFIAYEDLDPFGHVEPWGLYTRYGQTGVIIGAIVRFCFSPSWHT